MKRYLLFCLSFLLLSCMALPAFAHKPSDSYLKLNVQDTQVQGQWDIALRDLDYAIGLDSNDDGMITWGELRAHQSAVTAYALAHLQILTNQTLCPLKPTNYLVDNHTDGTYAVLRFVATCPQKSDRLEVRYQLFFDLDPQHRGLLQLTSPEQTRTAIFSPDQADQTLALAENPVVQFLQFGREGVWHIWIGFDHILFLLALLLPAVLQRHDKTWEPVADLPTAFKNVLKIVTAFTVAHSITLTLATLGVVQLPSRLVESAIAVSVVLAAVNNVYPLLLGKRWVMAFVFGLIHGFGFASVLADLNLPKSALLLALVGFNIGVEVGQLVIVAIFLPLAFSLRKSQFYQQVTVVGGSVMIGLIASVWLTERVFDLKVLAF